MANIILENQKLRYSTLIHVNELHQGSLKNEITGTGKHDSIKIKGTGMVNNISRNGREYNFENLKKVWETMRTRPIRVDHLRGSRHIIGEVTQTNFRQEGQDTLFDYEGRIFNTEQYGDAVRMVKTGLWKEMSIEAFVNAQESNTGGLTKVHVNRFSGISVVDEGGFDGTSIHVAESIGDAIDNMVINQNNNKGGVLNMVEQNKEQTRSNETVTTGTEQPEKPANAPAENTENSENKPKENNPEEDNSESSNDNVSNNESLKNEIVELFKENLDLKGLRDEIKKSLEKQFSQDATSIRQVEAVSKEQTELQEEALKKYKANEISYEEYFERVGLI